MTQFSNRLLVWTDVAHIVIFHPDDLAHAEKWPIAWYAEPFIYPVESDAGRLISWCTKVDGNFVLRVTDGSLTDRERKYAGPHWVFPYRVGCVPLCGVGLV